MTTDKAHHLLFLTTEELAVLELVLLDVHDRILDHFEPFDLEKDGLCYADVEPLGRAAVLVLNKVQALQGELADRFHELLMPAPDWKLLLHRGQLRMFDPNTGKPVDHVEEADD